MAGYIGSKSSVTLVDGYTEAEADAEFVNDPNDVITVSGSNVGIGTSSPSSYYSTDLVVTVPDEGGITLVNAATHTSYLMFADGTSGADRYRGQLSYDHNVNGMAFATNAAERMRIDSSGKVLINRTSTAEDCKMNINHGSSWGLVLDGDGSGTDSHIMFSRSGSTRGYITSSSSSVSYNTSSDYRLKENVVDLTGASARINQLNPSRFNFIADGTDTVVDGFIAHEVATVVPEAITGTHNEVKVWKDSEELPDGVSAGDNKLDDDGNTIPVYQGIDQSKLVPLLTAALQEALAKIDAMETRLTALEG